MSSPLFAWTDDRDDEDGGEEQVAVDTGAEAAAARAAARAAVRLGAAARAKTPKAKQGR